jgi:hypothetical protein
VQINVACKGMTLQVAYFRLLQNIFIFRTMTAGKSAPERKSEPSHKCTAIDLEMKMRLIHKYEGR